MFINNIIEPYIRDPYYCRTYLVEEERPVVGSNVKYITYNSRFSQTTFLSFLVSIERSLTERSLLNSTSSLF